MKKVYIQFFYKIFIMFMLGCVSLIPKGTFAQETPKNRALLIACERFVTAPESTPAGLHNLNMMEKILQQDLRGFEIFRQYGIISSEEALLAAVCHAFRDARENDISLLYICTHGEYDVRKENAEAALLLSDGALEDRVSAAQLETMLDLIPGTKILIIDACNSSALIGKGAPPGEKTDRKTNHFQSSAYRMLLSSGANEPSWYWISSQETAPPGSSYFTTALALGAGLMGGFEADANHDGIITLQEMYQYLWVNQASSTVQMYPQDDSFPFIVYDRSLLQENQKGELIGFVFPSTALDPENPMLTFQYTARSNARVVYQITYQKKGVWDWDQAATIPDESEFDGDGDPLGDITPGRKEVTLDLSGILPPDWTYAMIHVITHVDHGSNSEPFIYAARVLSAKNKRDPKLSVQTAEVWEKAEGSELQIFIGHAVPCGMTVQIEDEQGKLIRRLAASRQTRPQVLTPEGSLFYWNGLDDQGAAVPEGKYSIVVSARIDGERYEARGEVAVK